MVSKDEGGSATEQRTAVSLREAGARLDCGRHGRRRKPAACAQLEFGGVEQIKEECRDVRGRWLEDLGKDLHYAARTLRRSPAFLLVSVVSLALGIGANTAIFSLINAVMLRPLPVREPQRLVQITRLRANGKPGVVSYPLFEYFRDNLKSISGAAAELASGSDDSDGRSGGRRSAPELVSGAHY